jgi:cytoskeletal protein RodZ
VRNLLALVGLAVVLFLGVGWYANWYTARVQTGTDGKLNVSVDVDQKKVGQDVGSATEKLGKFVSSATKAEPAPAGPELVGPPAPSGLKPPAGR